MKRTGGNSKFEKIVRMIEETEKLKSGAESSALKLADRLVPYTLAGTGLVYLLTRNVTKALSVLMVDFSCALKLAMPVSVLSAIREASENGITVKGGKFLEAVAAAETIVFDKTGTLTKAEPVVTSVISFEDRGEDELLRIAACLEEHFPHSMANAVVEAARKKGLKHKEMHSKVNYIVAHGISSSIGEKKVVIGSYHFVFEDEGVVVPAGLEEKFDNIPEDSSHLYMAIDGQLSAVICISDPVREEAREVLKKLKELGIRKVVMMTGDNERTAKAVAAKIGVDKYYAEVLPEDKARFVEKEKEKGRKVIMVGDGINDSPALSAADCGIAISGGAELAREIADITIVADNLNELVKLKTLSNLLMKQQLQEDCRYQRRTYRTWCLWSGSACYICSCTQSLHPCHRSFFNHQPYGVAMIKKAEVKDLPKLSELYEAARQYMRESGNPDQWGMSYPAEDILLNDIANGVLYTDEEFNFAFVLMGEEEAYKGIYEGSWLNDKPYLTLHRVAGNGKVKGVFSKVFEYSLMKMKEAGLSNIRIDTHEKNLTMQKALTRQGFVRCGLVRLREGKRIAYQYVVK